MSLSQSLLPEFDQEMANTRKTLERVPDEKFSWKPHEKSGSMGWLAAHLANLVGWTVETIKHDSFDMSPGGKPFTPPPVPKTRKELLELFDKNVSAFFHASNGLSSHLGDESHSPSSSAIRRLLAPEQYRGAFDLWSIG